ncbi:hypothetical protein [Agaribacter flavus]|uniref:Uncharacterized protein n=1 Tax=Agaribacter flavus TaxID=1902781 RepID=A0ABV7FVT0_9ALTE
MFKVFSLFLFVAMSFKTQACSCDLGSPEDKLATFDSVFLGKLIEIKNKGTTNAFNEPEIEVTFEQIRRFKGTDKDVVLDTNFNRASCTGYWFKEGQTMLVYASLNDGKLDVMWCGGVIVKEENPEQLQNELIALEEVLRNAS